MRLCSFWTQICLHLAMLKCKKKAQVTCLTPSMQTQFQSPRLYQLKPYRGKEKQWDPVWGVLNSAGKHKMDCLSFFIISNISLFYFLSLFVCFNPSTSPPISVSASLSPHAIALPNQLPLPFLPLEVSMLPGKNLKKQRDERKRPIYCIKSDANVPLQHCQLSLITANPVIFGVFWLTRSWETLDFIFYLSVFSFLKVMEKTVHVWSLLWKASKSTNSTF